MIRRAIRGINVSAESLATDVIARIGPGGTFFGDKHTFEFYEKEKFLTELFENEDSVYQMARLK